MRLREGVRHNCFNHYEKKENYKEDETPFLMSMENKMGLGELPAHLPKFTHDYSLTCTDDGVSISRPPVSLFRPLREFYVSQNGGRCSTKFTL
jgi:hypothetical protein